MSRLKQRYQSTIREQLQKKFSYANLMQIPRLQKIVINMGIAEAAKDKNIIQYHIDELAALSGQMPIVTRAHKAISNFKLREGQPIGMKVTLRGVRMFDFLDRFINVVVPRIRDFRGFAEKGDRQGNYTIGLDDQQVFPEIDLDKVKRTQGMHISIVTSAQTDEECLELLRLFGMPFKNLPVEVAA